MQLLPSPLVRASWLAFSIAFFFSITRERGRGERNILNRKQPERHGSYFKKIQPKQARLGGITDVALGVEQGASVWKGRHVLSPCSPPPPSQFLLVVKGNKKGSCIEAADGES